MLKIFWAEFEFFEWKGSQIMVQFIEILFCCKNKLNFHSVIVRFYLTWEIEIEIYCEFVRKF